MPIYACIKDEVVVNTLVIEENASELIDQLKLEFDYDLIVPTDDQPVVVGDGYVNAVFVLSSPVIDEVVNNDFEVMENEPVRLEGVPYIPE